MKNGEHLRMTAVVWGATIPQPSIDDEQQNLFRSNNWMVRLTSCERERGIDIRAFEIRVIEKDCLPRLAIRQ